MSTRGSIADAAGMQEAWYQNQGVPGDWITGNRILDVALLPLAFAVAFPLLRRALKTRVFQPTGEAILLQLGKKQDVQWTQEQLAAKLLKWNESCWKMVVYTVFSVTALLVVFREPYFTSPSHMWRGANQFPLNYPVPLKMILFYLLQIGFYLQAIPFLIFVEVRRSDWMESFAHHVITLLLMYYSWYCNFTRPGVMLMLLHDPSDIFLEAAKLAKYAGKEALASNMFIAFALSWIVLRVIIYPYMIVSRMPIDPIVHLVIPYNINSQPHYAILGTLTLLLFFLHLYWTYLILRVIVKQLKTGSTEDVREEDSYDGR